MTAKPATVRSGAERASSQEMTDPLLKRVERRALALAFIAATVALFVPGGGGWRAAAGVLGGASLIGVSYWAIRSGVRGLADAVIARPETRAHVTRGVALVILRYALLAGLAYVMIARLRLPPIGLLIGASVIVVAAALELVRGAHRT
jgi:hypothetical protein